MHSVRLPRRVNPGTHGSDRFAVARVAALLLLEGELGEAVRVLEGGVVEGLGARDDARLVAAVHHETLEEGQALTAKLGHALLLRQRLRQAQREACRIGGRHSSGVHEHLVAATCRCHRSCCSRR